MNKIKLGLIGCGNLIDFMYGPSFPYLQSGVLYAVMDINKERAERAAKLCGAEKVYTNLDDFLSDKNIDAVMIGTPTQFHCQNVVKSAQAGKHILCEKPMAVYVDECREMVEACKKHNVILMVAFMKRFNPSFQIVKKFIDEGGLGEIFEMRAIWDNARAICSRDNYRHQKLTGGGFLQEDGSHPIDIIHWWMGDVVNVNAHILLVGADHYDNDSVAMVSMNHKNKAISSLHITMLTHCTGIERYEVFGIKGTLIMEWPYHSSRTNEPARIFLYQDARKVVDLTEDLNKPPDGVLNWNPIERHKRNWQYLLELEHFCECVKKGKAPKVKGEDGSAVVEILNAAYLSALKNQVVKLPITERPDFDALFEPFKSMTNWNINKGWYSHY